MDGFKELWKQYEERLINGVGLVAFVAFWTGLVLAIGGCMYYAHEKNGNILDIYEDGAFLWQKKDKEWGESDDGVYEIKDDSGGWKEGEITYSFTLTYVEDSEVPFFIINYDWTGNLLNWEIWMEDEQGNILHKIIRIHSGSGSYLLSEVDRDLDNKTCTLKGKMPGIKESIAKRTKKMQLRATWNQPNQKTGIRMNIPFSNNDNRLKSDTGEIHEANRRD
jgi:hypothetical protein